jgi:hypothetical protein
MGHEASPHSVHFGHESKAIIVLNAEAAIE